ncbi:MAG: hypothetical protein ACIAQU_09215 [Phycisphaerales bacterium JB064]
MVHTTMMSGLRLGVAIGLLASAVARAQDAPADAEDAPSQIRTPDEAREWLRDEMVRVLGDMAGGSFDDVAFNRWFDALDEPWMQAMADGTLAEDGDVDHPIFDNTWWPAGLTERGVPMPATPEGLDERVREPWEWAGEQQRLVWEAQQPGPNAVNRWPEVFTLVSRYDATFEAEVQRVQERFALQGDASSAVRGLIERLPDMLEEDRLALEAHPEHERLMEAIDASLASIDVRIAKASKALRSADPAAVYLVPIPPSIAFTVPVEKLGPARSLGRYLAGRAAVALEEERFQDAAADLALSLEVANAYARVPGMISALVSWDIARRSLRSIIDNASGKAVPAEDLRRLDAALDRFVPLPPSYAIRGGANECYAAVDDFYRQVRATVPRNEGLRNSMMDLSRSAGVLTSRGNQMALVQEAFESIAVMADGRYETTEIDAVYGRALHVLAWLDTKEGQRDMGGTRLPVLGVLLPAVGRYMQSHVALTQHRHGAALLMAIEIHRAEHGELPASLTDLPEHAFRFEADLPARLREQPPIRYHVLDERASGFGMGYVLYAVGADGVDNGGLSHPDYPESVLTGSGRRDGYDYVFNTPGR